MPMQQGVSASAGPMRASIRTKPVPRLVESPENSRNHLAVERIGRSYGECRLITGNCLEESGMSKGHHSIIRRYAYACELLDRGTDEDLRQAFVNFDQIIDLTARRLILEGMIERSLVEKFGGALLLKRDRQRRQELLSAFLQQKGMRTSVHDLRDIQEQRNRFYHEDADILPSRSLLVDVSRHVQDIMRVAFNIDVSEAVQQIAFDSMLQKSGASVLQNRALRIGAKVLELATRVAEHFDVTDTAALSAEGILEEGRYSSSQCFKGASA
ncbi:MAG: hypothetical protein ACYDEW_00870 [Vulcanimicrobiaceae bacterium]